MPNRINKSSQDSRNDAPGREIRRNTHTLFIQQFQKEAQERVREMQDKLKNDLATVDKVFSVELMKMTPSLKNMRMGDLLSSVNTPASDVSIALMNEAIEIQQPLGRATRKRLKSTDSPPVQATAKGKVQKGGSTKRMRTRTLPGSTSVGNLRPTTAAVKRTESMKTNNDKSATIKPKLRSVVSTGDLPSSLTGSFAHISVTTREGLTVCFSEETKDQDINWELLDDVAWCQIQRLTLTPLFSRLFSCPT